VNEEAVFFCLSYNFVYLLYLCPSLDIGYVKLINKWLNQKGIRNNYQNSCLGIARKKHAIIIITRILAKIQSRVTALDAWRKIFKQVNLCDASELMPPFCRNIFEHIHFQPIVKQIVGKKTDRCN